MNEGHMDQKQKSSEEVFLEGLKLTIGKKIKLIKKHIIGSSNVPIGAEMEGVLTNDVKIGEPIFLDDKTKVISNISGAGTKEGRIFLKTNTSIYELIVDAPEKRSDIILTMKDLEKELEIYNKKGYDQFDLFNHKVPLKDDPYNLFIINSGLKQADEVVYFSDGKERKGKIVEDNNGEFYILTSKGDRLGIGFLENDSSNYIKKV